MKNHWFKFFLISNFVSFYLLATTKALAFSSINDYYLELERSAVKSINTYWIGKGNNREGRKLAWRWAIYADAAIEAFERTGEKRFLHLTLNGCLFALGVRDKNLAIVDESRNYAGPSWSSLVRTDKYDRSKRKYTQEITVSGLVLLPCLKAVRSIKSRPKIESDYSVLTFAILEAANEIYELHLTDCPSIVYRNTSHRYCITPTEGEIEPINHIAAYGAMLSVLYGVTRDDKIGTFTTELARFIKSCMKEQSNGSLSWSYRPLVSECLQDLADEPTRYSKRGSWESAAEPFWKARTTILFPIYAYETGILFTKEDIANIYRTFSNNIVSEQKICKRIDSGRCYTMNKDFYLQSSIAAWAILGKFESRVLVDLENLVVARPDIFPKKWRTSPWSIFAWSQLIKSNLGTSS